MPEYLIFFIAWFFAALVNNIAGFGAAMIAMPLIASSVPLSIAVPSSTLIVLVLNLQVGWNYRQYIQWQALRYLAAGAIAGTAVGLFILTTVGNATLKLAMGLTLIGYALCSMYKSKKKQPREALHESWGIVAGFFSTTLGSLFGFNGPALAVFTSATGLTQDEAKGVLGACFILTGITILAGQCLSGIHSLQTLTYSAIACPAVLLGGGAGLMLSRFIKPLAYQTIVLTLILVSGVSVVWACL